MASGHEVTLKLTQIEATRRGWRLFKNIIGTGFIGQVVEEYDSSAGHIVTLKNARRVQFGVCNPGGLDLIGWQTVEITPEMVGKKIAVFTAVDGKTQGYKSMSAEQKNFSREVKSAGGKAYTAMKAEDGVKINEVHA